MMTVERASELVNKLKGDDKYDLFGFFEQQLNPGHDVNGEPWSQWFARLCGFGIATQVKEITIEEALAFMYPGCGYNDTNN